MFNISNNINIDIPTSWNRCTLTQLRAISEIMIELTEHSTPLNPFDMRAFKLAVFFCLAELEITKPLDTNLPVGEQHYYVRKQGSRFFHLKNKILKRNKPFSLFLWQIYYWLFPEQEKSKKNRRKGILDWLGNDSGDTLLLLPIEKIRRGPWYKRKVFLGPAPMLDGFTWQRYRFAQDYMQSYMELSNKLCQLSKLGRRVQAKTIITITKELDKVRAMFLANLFEDKVRYIDESTGETRYDYHYYTSQAQVNAHYFRNFSNSDWQIVLLYWSGVMQWLSKTYPRVFKKQNVKKNQSVNPLELYARTTATMEKYIGLSADQVEREPYTTILQQMEDIALQNEELDKIKHKK
ncbi:MAG: hypothetical protein HUK06_01485 [Bacteroidaceae bacterium]|nr:hypothetical protein [Bacteroidaceae bacterium]